jgi:cysteine-rich repeat protein
MLFRYLAAIISIALVLAACGSTSPQRKKCESNCSAKYECPPGEPNPACEAALADCQDNCADGATASAGLPLTPTLQARWMISDDYAPATATACNNPASGDWCKCGSDYTNAAASCVEVGATMFLEYEAPGVPVAPGARLKFDATVSTTNNPSGVDVTMRRIKPAVTRPTMGQAGYCPTTSQASWFRAGPTAWALPGAKGDGTDRTTIEATRTDGTGAPANGTAGAPLGNHIAKNDNQVTYYWDVTALLNDCPAAGMCVLALYMDAGTHINVLGGTTALEYFPAGPVPVCGDGAVAGSETCDDSNATAGDGCSALCAVEAGYGCSGAPSACATTCGDGVKAGAEECDNGAANGSNAPCSAACAAQACGCSPP